jgi:hypothetical protein
MEELREALHKQQMSQKTHHSLTSAGLEVRSLTRVSAALIYTLISFFKNGLLFTIRIISPLTAQLAHLEGISRGSRGSTANSSPGSGYLTPVQSPRSRGGSEDNATEEQKASGEYSIANFGRVIVTDVSTSVQTRSGIHVAAEAAV